MNNFKHYAGIIFLHILIPIGITFFAKLIIDLCTLNVTDSSVQLSAETVSYQNMIKSLVDTFQWVVSVFIGILTYFIINSREIQTSIKGFYSDLGNKLVKTNAIIENPETKKIAVTAQELDFYERKIYEEIDKYSESDKGTAESIDILRWYSLQDLLFSPRYLNYFFNRGKQIGHPIRLIVIEKVCLATITFLFLNLKAGYNTYIISNSKFKKFYSKLKLSQQKILKGNPYLIKIQNDVKYGRYSNEIGEATSITKCDEIWKICNELIKQSEKVSNASDTFSIKEIESILNGS